MRKRKGLVGAVFLCWFLFSSWCLCCEYLLPNVVRISEGERFRYKNGLLTVSSVSGNAEPTSLTAGNSCEGTLMLFGALPIKRVRVTVSSPMTLIPSGEPFGVKMFASGVVVVGVGPVDTSRGRVYPSKEAGIIKGDVIISIDGQNVGSNESVAAVVANSDGGPLEVKLKRGELIKTVYLTPAEAADGSGLKAGLWVRDSAAGIGTLTYIDPVQGIAAGLGHGITDKDTGELVPLGSGEMVSIKIVGCDRGQQGTAGALKGSFVGGTHLAQLIYNSSQGVFGKIYDYDGDTAAGLPVAYKQQVHKGAAKILCTVNGKTPQYYDVSVESVNISDSAAIKNMVIRVTDGQLLAATGGIVQGMSGSPIIQDGCIIGAVTHVFINDPTRGYGIFIENMLKAEGQASLSLQIGQAA